jgi:hypothetical protein
VQHGSTVKSSVFTHVMHAGMALLCRGTFNDVTAPDDACSQDAQTMHVLSLSMDIVCTFVLVVLANDLITVVQVSDPAVPTDVDPAEDALGALQDRSREHSNSVPQARMHRRPHHGSHSASTNVGARCVAHADAESLQAVRRAASFSRHGCDSTQAVAHAASLGNHDR